MGVPLRRNRRRCGRGSGQHVAVTELIEPRLLTAIEHIDRREPLCRVGGQRPHHSLESLDQRLDAGRVEHIGAELHRPADTGRLTGLGEALSQGKRQIHAGGAGIHRNRGELQITQSRSGGGVVVRPGEVLPAHHHLHQRVVRQASGRVEPLHQQLEGHVLVLVGGQAAPAHLGQQFGDGGIPRHLNSEHQGVDEEPHQLVERGIAAPGDREPHRHIGTGAEL